MSGQTNPESNGEGYDGEALPLTCPFSCSWSSSSLTGARTGKDLLSHPHGPYVRSERKEENVCYLRRRRYKNGKKFPSG